MCRHFSQRCINCNSNVSERLYCWEAYKVVRCVIVQCEERWNTSSRSIPSPLLNKRPGFLRREKDHQPDVEYEDEYGAQTVFCPNTKCNTIYMVGVVKEVGPKGRCYVGVQKVEPEGKGSSSQRTNTGLSGMTLVDHSK